MKKLSSTLLPLFFTLSLLSQQIECCDSIHHSQYIDSEWYSTYSNSFSKISDNELLQYGYRFELLSGDQELVSKSNIVFNANGDMVQTVYHVFNTQTEEFTQRAKSDLSYDTSQNLIQMNYFEWNEDDGTWVKKMRRTYDNYDQYSNYQNYSIFEGNFTDEWVLSQEGTRSHIYINGLLDSMTNNSGNTSISTYKFEYDEDGREILETLRSGSQLTIGKIIESEYNDQGLLKNETIITGAELSPSARSSYEYDALNRLEVEYQENYNSAGDPFLTFKWEHFCEGTSNTKEESELNANCNWTCLSGEQVNFHITNLNQNETYQFSLYDQSGRFIKMLTIRNQTSIHKTYKLAQGKYFLVISDSKNRSYAESIISF